MGTWEEVGKRMIKEKNDNGRERKNDKRDRPKYLFKNYCAVFHFPYYSFPLFLA
jgi:hypothetical protein